VAWSVLQPMTATNPGGERGARAVELDVLRGLSALAVIVLHAGSDPLTEQAALGDASWTLLVPNAAARFAVPVFMMLSGMGLTLSARHAETYPRFVWRRLSSIIPEYVVWTFIYAWLLPHDEPLSGLTLLDYLITGHASRHLYFVPAVVRLYLLYPVMRYFARGAWGVAGCCALSWSMIWLTPLLERMPLGALLGDLLPLRWMGYFVLGIWLAEARKQNSGAALTGVRVLAPLVALASLACIVAIVRYVVARSADIEVALGAAEPLILPYSVCVLLWWSGLTFANGRLVRFLRFVSDHSYGVYLSHSLMLYVCAIGLEALPGEHTPLISFATGVAFGIPLSLATAWLTERIKRMPFRSTGALSMA
jgi:probable poly-beta-1,6-N-acetyl-D-glucosamine export protein